MRIVALSDTHMHHDSVFIPDGDVVVHCGDFGSFGDGIEVGEALQWFRRLPHERKLCIPGNHDLVAEDDPVFMQDILGPEVDYLVEKTVEIDGFKFWGSPIQPEFRDWAFNRSKKFRLTYWDENLPNDTDILLTHCPPRNILDANWRGEHVGDKHLRRNVLERVKPLLHVFGHIHESRGCCTVQQEDPSDLYSGVSFINACVVDQNLHPVHSCWVVDVDKNGVTLVSK